MTCSARAGALGLLLAASCATDPGPQPTLDAYRAALEAKDPAAVHGLLSQAAAGRYTADMLAQKIAEDPRAGAEIAAALAGASARRYAEIELADGARVRLVEEGGAWRIDDLGFVVAPAGSPEAAFTTFVRAARAGRLDAVRAVMPARFVARFAQDAALAAHLDGLQPRIDAAWAALAPVPEGRAEVDGDRARLPYGDGRSVRLVRENGTWRVLDVE